MTTRSVGGPVLQGDLLPEGMVTGFGFKPHPIVTAAQDQLLLDSDEPASQPPDRAVPRSAATAMRLAASPPDRLPESRIHDAASIDAELAQRIAALLNLRGRPWTGVAIPLLTTLTEGGHLIWIAGGASRDVVAGGPIGEVNDLDLTGTAPPGLFSELARRSLRRLGMDVRHKVSPDSLVCSAQPAMRGPRFYEYRALNTPAFSFPACASDLHADACMRDFTINAIYYDPTCDVVIDPTGRGLADLRCDRRLLVPLASDLSATAQGAILLRAIKFVERWSTRVDIDNVGMQLWLQSLPADLVTHIEEESLKILTRKYQASFNGIEKESIRSAADRLGGAAIKFVLALAERVE
jgi:poly(A) polymerase